MVGSPSAARGSRDTAGEILAAARRRYARFGPRKTTMEEVARDAGCSRATLYAHFPGKHALYKGLLEEETRTILAGLEAAVASDLPVPEKLGRIVAATVESYAGRPVLRDALSGDAEMTLDRVARPAIAAHERRVIELLERVLHQGVLAGDFRALDVGATAQLMYQLGRVLVLREVSGDAELPLERILRVMNDVIARGIASRTREDEK